MLSRAWVCTDLPHSLIFSRDGSPASPACRCLFLFSGPLHSHATGLSDPRAAQHHAYHQVCLLCFSHFFRVSGDLELLIPLPPSTKITGVRPHTGLQALPLTASFLPLKWALDLDSQSRAKAAGIPLLRVLMAFAPPPWTLSSTLKLLYKESKPNKPGTLLCLLTKAKHSLLWRRAGRFPLGSSEQRLQQELAT